MPNATNPFIPLQKIFAYYIIAIASMMLGIFLSTGSDGYAGLSMMQLLWVAALLCLPSAYFYSIHTLIYKTGDDGRSILIEIIKGIYAVAITFGTLYILDFSLSYFLEPISSVALYYTKWFILIFCGFYLCTAFLYRYFFESHRTNYTHYRIVRYQLMFPSIITIGLSFFAGYTFKFFLLGNSKYVEATTVLFTAYIVYGAIIFIGLKKKRDANKNYMILWNCIFGFLCLAGVILAFQKSLANDITFKIYAETFLVMVLGILLSAFLAIFESAHILENVIFSDDRISIEKNYKMLTIISFLIFAFIFILNNFLDLISIDFVDVYKNGNSFRAPQFSYHPTILLVFLCVIMVYSFMWFFTNPSLYKEKKFGLTKILFAIIIFISLGFQFRITNNIQQTAYEYFGITRFLPINFFENPLLYICILFSLLMILLCLYRKDIFLTQFASLAIAMSILSCAEIFIAFLGSYEKGFNKNVSYSDIGFAAINTLTVNKLICTEACLILLHIATIIMCFVLASKYNIYKKIFVSENVPVIP